MTLEKFNQKYAYLGGWGKVMELREQGLSWAQTAGYFHLTKEYLWRLDKKFRQIDSLSHK